MLSKGLVGLVSQLPEQGQLSVSPMESVEMFVRMPHGQQEIAASRIQNDGKSRNGQHHGAALMEKFGHEFHAMTELVPSSTGIRSRASSVAVTNSRA